MYIIVLYRPARQLVWAWLAADVCNSILTLLLIAELSNRQATEEQESALAEKEDKATAIRDKHTDKPSVSNTKQLSSNDVKESVDKLTRDIEYSYQQLIASLDEEKDDDPSVAQLKDSITNKYAEFGKLRERRAKEEALEKLWTESEATCIQ